MGGKGKRSVGHRRIPNCSCKFVEFSGALEIEISFLRHSASPALFVLFHFRTCFSGLRLSASDPDCFLLMAVPYFRLAHAVSQSKMVFHVTRCPPPAFHLRLPRSPHALLLVARRRSFFVLMGGTSSGVVTSCFSPLTRRALFSSLLLSVILITGGAQHLPGRPRVPGPKRAADRRQPAAPRRQRRRLAAAEGGPTGRRTRTYARSPGCSG